MSKIQEAGTAGSVIFTSTNPKVTQTVSGAAVARELLFLLIRDSSILTRLAFQANGNELLRYI